MLDINDLIWYCNEIRRQIEKTRYHAPNNHHPLLKYVRSNSFLPSRTTSHQPATTTTTAAASSYSFSNVLSSVIDWMLISSNIFQKNLLGKFIFYNLCTSTTIGVKCSTTISNEMHWIDRKVRMRKLMSIIWCEILFSSETFQRVLLQIIEQSFNNIYDEFARELAKPSAMTTSQQSSEMNLFEQISSEKLSIISSSFSLLEVIQRF